MQTPACAIMKHNNPSGVAAHSSMSEAYYKANMADRIAAFGGAAVFNRTLDKPTAELIAENYLEVVAAPDYEEGTVEILSKRRNLRILAIPRIDRLQDYVNMRFVDFKSLIDGGIIVQQSAVNAIRSPEDLVLARAKHQGKEYVIERLPTEREIQDMIWLPGAGSHLQFSVTKDGCTVGIGTGEQDRAVAELAVVKAQIPDRLCFERHLVPLMN
jgi:phosphoribosylaminoimidazolecarboxamide formyltransferase/IMP cyclohydrolase